MPIVNVAEFVVTESKVNFGDAGGIGLEVLESMELSALAPAASVHISFNEMAESGFKLFTLSVQYLSFNVLSSTKSPALAEPEQV